MSKIGPRISNVVTSSPDKTTCVRDVLLIPVFNFEYRQLKGVENPWLVKYISFYSLKYYITFLEVYGNHSHR